jgi:hypothetical protein
MNTDDILDIIDSGLHRVAVTVKDAVKKAWDTGKPDPNNADMKAFSFTTRSNAAKLLNKELSALRRRIIDTIPTDDPCFNRLTEVTYAMTLYKREALITGIFIYMKYNLEGYIPRGDTTDTGTPPVCRKDDPEEYRRTMRALASYIQ